MKHFLIDKNYGAYLSGMGFSMDEVLKKAMLPEDLFARQTPSLTAEEYFRFMGGDWHPFAGRADADSFGGVGRYRSIFTTHFCGILQPQCACVPETPGAV